MKAHLPIRQRRATAVWLLIPLLCLGGTGLARATDAAPAAAKALPAAVTVQAKTFSPHLSAYGQVVPTAMVKVRVVNAGVVRDLHVLPGSLVSAGQILAKLSGTRMQALLTQRETAVRSAQARLDAARQALAIARRQLAAQLSTRQAVDAAASELAAARAARQTAQAQLDEARDQQIFKAPTAGAVVAVQAANGEEVSPGQTLLTLQPAGKLWVRAEYFGAAAAAVHVGMSGHFEPAGGGAPLAVKVATVGAALDADGGTQVGLSPAQATGAAPWTSGQWGRVTLDGAPQAMLAVPTASLILDRGNWWVMVRTAHGDEPRQVVPGPARGWQTWISSGLRAGEQVVAQDAFLEYHRGIAHAYQPPD
ncbi:MAG: efflux RND transporter periplasmic adaptor subunit [Burkholderiales bacterium]|nr:efflux RND transporter periplasmic adaptor subunit [Burkholderiales bacterium]